MISLPSLLLAPTMGTTARLISPGDVSTMNTPRIIFLAFAALVVIGALSTIMRKNDVAAVMSLVATFFGLAAIYTFLSAHFIAVLQVLVYAGAIMVLFIFVVMVLNRDETDPWVWRGLLGKIFLGVLPMSWVCARLITFFGRVTTAQPGPPNEEFGTVAQIGQLLFTDYLFAFEAVSVLLMIAVIAALVVARTSKHAAPATSPTPHPEHQFGDAHTGALYDATAPAPHGTGGH